MIACPKKRSPLALFALLSLVAHMAVFYTADLLRPFDLGPPVQLLPAISVTLKEAGGQTPRPAPSLVHPKREIEEQLGRPIVTSKEEAQEEADDGLQRSGPLVPTQKDSPPPHMPSLSTPPPVAAGIAAPPKMYAAAAPVKAAVANVKLPIARDYRKLAGPVRTVDEFLTTTREKLTYRITLLDIPVGSAVLEAVNIDGEMRITVRIESSSAIAAFYPVDDLVETRMIKGNYLLTRIRQREGDYRGDFAFTLMLREQKAFWIDRLANRYDFQPLPAKDATDPLSGLYFLRSQLLDVGKIVQLHLFDGTGYSPATVEVLRRERLKLANQQEKDTIVVRPQIPAAGLFKKNRDLLVWLTDDACKAPVKMQSSTPIGRVTAELISSETDPSPLSSDKL